ncbi:hypothetical protein D3C85_1483590 [compost metagenome]
MTLQTKSNCVRKFRIKHLGSIEIKCQVKMTPTGLHQLLRSQTLIQQFSEHGIEKATALNHRQKNTGCQHTTAITHPPHKHFGTDTLSRLQLHLRLEAGPKLLTLEPQPHFSLGRLSQMQWRMPDGCP